MKEKLKFYTDENVPTAVVKGLQRREIDVLTAKMAIMLGASDEKHLLLATTQGRVIFTQDDDFLRLHARGMKHNGIVYAHQQTPIGNIISGLVLIYQALNRNDMKNHIEFL